MHGIPGWVWVIALAVLAFKSPRIYYFVQVGRRKKGHIRFRVRRIVVGLVFYLGGIFVLLKMGNRPLESILFGFVTAIAAELFFVPRPVRSRVIPKHVRRAVIERDLRGERFDPSLHHIDHIVPYSKGGDHSVTNLRVLPKAANLRRGSRMPTMDELAPPILKRLRKVN